jgi:hypothetical protein
MEIGDCQVKLAIIHILDIQKDRWTERSGGLDITQLKRSTLMPDIQVSSGPFYQWKIKCLLWDLRFSPQCYWRFCLFVGCYALSTCKEFPMFQRIIMPSASGHFVPSKGLELITHCWKLNILESSSVIFLFLSTCPASLAPGTAQPVEWLGYWLENLGFKSQQKRSFVLQYVWIDYGVHPASKLMGIMVLFPRR